MVPWIGMQCVIVAFPESYLLLEFFQLHFIFVLFHRRLFLVLGNITKKSK